MITDPEWIGTFNYVNATILNDANPGIGEMYANTKTERSELHKTLDVDPWVTLGNTRELHRGDMQRLAKLYGSVASGGITAGRNDIENLSGIVLEGTNILGEDIKDKVKEANKPMNDAIESSEKNLLDWIEWLNHPFGKKFGKDSEDNYEE